MDWLSAENVVAVLTALLSAVLPPAIAAVYRRRVRRGRRIGYRVQLDTPIGSDDGGPGRANVRLGLFGDLPEMSDATMVLLRIENDGGEAIAEADYTSADPLHGLSAVFTGRTVRGVSVTQLDSEHLMDHFAAPRAIEHSGSTINLPRVPLNRGQHYKLFVLLTGGGVGREVRVDGGLREGAVVPNRSTAVDDKPPALSGAARWAIGVMMAGVLVLASVIVVSGDSHPMGCATGRLSVVGSTAFKPALDDLAAQYEEECPGAHITVSSHGSGEGVGDLVRQGDAAKDGQPAVVAFSDGATTVSSPHLTESRVAVAAFAMVVNDQVPVTNLTLAQIRSLYAGDTRVLNWDQVGSGGPDLPVRLVSRKDGSGTRNLFEQQILARGGEPPRTSADCATSILPNSLFHGVRCELDSTQDVVGKVAQLPGAIGYAELQAAKDTKGLHILDIDGHAPTRAAIEDGGYPFTVVEYAYTYGRPSGSSLAGSFVDFTLGSGGLRVLESDGHLACQSPEGFTRCGAGAGSASGAGAG